MSYYTYRGDESEEEDMEEIRYPDNFDGNFAFENFWLQCV